MTEALRCPITPSSVKPDPHSGVPSHHGIVLSKAVASSHWWLFRLNMNVKCKFSSSVTQASSSGALDHV